MTPRLRINKNIRAKELRVIGVDGANLGVISLDQALKEAEDAGLDLIEISPNATPPIAKLADYGKFQYEQNKKAKEIKSKAKDIEVKGVQVKIGTGEHDLDLKAKKISEWLGEGHRVKIDLFIPGRSKYLDEKFLKERLERILKLDVTPYKIAEEIKKGPKGMTMVIEKSK